MKWVQSGVLLIVVGQVLSLACSPQPSRDSPYFESWPPEKTGIVWKHDNAMSVRRYLPESMGPGVAIFDYDNDGWMDLYFTNSGPADFFAPTHPLRTTTTTVPSPM
jgi:hypothetical protein